MAQVLKGVITQVCEGGSAVIRPYGQGSALTPPLPAQKITVNIPPISGGDHTHGAVAVIVTHPALDVGKRVVFVLFDDGSGAVLGDA